MALSDADLLRDFYVIAVVTNPERFETRYRLFREFMARMHGYGAKLLIVEGAYGDRPFEITEEGNPWHVRVRTESELWHKENLINLGISRLPTTWKYVAWIDGDLDFVRPDWMLETVHELQHHAVVQMFEDAIDLGPQHEFLTVTKSFMSCHKKGLIPGGGAKTVETAAASDGASSSSSYLPLYKMVRGGQLVWHPGYAWAATREAIDTVGGLFELAVLGAADHHMACALIGKGELSLPKAIHPNYKSAVMRWQERADRLHHNVGYVRGTIYHFWHGKKKDRKYKERWSVLQDCAYDPLRDVHRDWQGVLSLYPGHEALRDAIRGYFLARNEDSIDK